MDIQFTEEQELLVLDGLAYVKDAAGDLKLAPGLRVDVPSSLRLDVIESARECPGNCIHVNRVDDGAPVAGPDS